MRPRHSLHVLGALLQRRGRASVGGPRKPESRSRQGQSKMGQGRCESVAGGQTSAGGRGGMRGAAASSVAARKLQRRSLAWNGANGQCG